MLYCVQAPFKTSHHSSLLGQSTPYFVLTTYLQIMSHKAWRRIAKRERRRRIRTAKAKELKEEEERAEAAMKLSPGFETWLKEQNVLELFKEKEQERINEEENGKWMRAELIAQQQWREIRSKVEKAHLQRAEQELRIRKEWEQEQEKIQLAQKKIKEVEAEKQQKYQRFLENLESYLSGSTNSLPAELTASQQTKPNMQPCPFFLKTACCRFGDACSRNHMYPGVSKILLATNFYNQFDTDISLEYDDSDTYTEYKNFFFDVLPEFEKFGEVVHFKVCSNWEKHLRGNVYVEYAHLRDALSAYRALHARWYAGRQLSLHFCNVPNWAAAICRMFLSRRCPKGLSCNFLHVFKNPDLKFDGCISRRRDHKQERNKENARNWRWSESPEYIPKPKRRSRSSSRSKKRRKSRNKSRSKTKTPPKRKRSRTRTTNKKSKHN